MESSFWIWIGMESIGFIITELSIHIFVSLFHISQIISNECKRDFDKTNAELLFSS